MKVRGLCCYLSKYKGSLLAVYATLVPTYSLPSCRLVRCSRNLKYRAINDRCTLSFFVPGLSYPETSPSMSCHAENTSLRQAIIWRKASDDSAPYFLLWMRPPLETVTSPWVAPTCDAPSLKYIESAVECLWRRQSTKKKEDAMLPVVTSDSQQQVVT